MGGGRLPRNPFSAAQRAGAPTREAARRPGARVVSIDHATMRELSVGEACEGAYGRDRKGPAFLVDSMVDSGIVFSMAADVSRLV